MADESVSTLTYTVWATAWGPTAAVADGEALCRFVLPHYRMDELEDLLRWEHPGCRRQDAAFEPLIELVRQYFNGQAVRFDTISCHLPGETTFAGQVLRACRQILFGETLSYRQLALRIGREDAARAVAAALGKNRIPLVVPCHRVTYADGRAGGFSAAGGVELKQRMLAMEAAADS